MSFQKIEIQGFKSFKEKVVLKFTQDITGIVGPNGSGKSNISDAIKWVLGEQSAKSLRGSKMEDVIFAGTEKISPVNVAKVSMVFDNKSKWLPIDYSEVVIERRVYRTGESNYYINKSKCKLRDIKELFLDTGVGTDGYSIIGQGRIDSILNSKSDERREIFEEASGIAKLKYKKEESLKKLDRARENVRQIEELLKTRRTELYYLKKEATKAKKGASLTEELFIKDRDYTCNKFHSFSTKMNHLIADQNIKVKANNENLDQLKKLNLEYKHTQEKLLKIEKEIEEIEHKYGHIEKNISTTSSNIEIFKERIKSLESQKIHLKELSTDQENRLFETQKELDEFLAEEKELYLRVESLNNEYQKKNHDLDQLDSQILNLKEKFRKKESQYILKKEQYQELLAQKNADKHITLKQEHQKEEYNKKSDVIKREIHSVEKEFQTVLHQTENFTKDLEEIQVEKEKTEKELREFLEIVEKNYDDRTKLQVQIQDVENRLLFLNQVKENYEGYYYQVAEFFKKIKNSNLNKNVVGSLASLIHIKDGYEKVIEILLGGNLQSIVVHTNKEAKELVQFLKDEKIGRLTFLPIEEIRPRYYTQDIQDSSILCKANEVILCKDGSQGIIDYFLNRTLIVKNMEDALQAKRNYKNYRIATIDGDVINTWGSVVGGYKKSNLKGSSLLNRDKDIQKLENKSKELNFSWIEMNKNIDLGKSQIENLKKQLYQYEKQMEALEATKNESKNNSFSLEHKLEILNTRLEELRNYYSGRFYEGFTKENEMELKSLEEILPESKEELVIIEKEINLLTEKFNEDKLTHHKLDNDLQLEKRNLLLLENQKYKLMDQKESLESILNKGKEDYSTTKKELVEYQKKIIKLSKELKSLEEGALKFEKLNPSIKKERTVLLEKKEELLRQLQESKEFDMELKYELKSLEDKISNFSDKKESLCQYFSDEYQLDLEKQSYDKIDDMETMERIKKEVATIKKDLFKIGDFDLSAIERYEEESTSLREIEKQQEDLLDTANNLEKIIRSLNITMKDTFSDSIQKINKNFSRIFNILFSGGKASLVLDEDNILESNIDILAEPPGKKLQNLNLLSGGERSLTAVALLFAIFENRPSPFCVLDEIDAALDEANIHRYTSYLKSLSNQTQFIMITHRKTTMEIADVLYGVSMEKEGISSVLTLALN